MSNQYFLKTYNFFYIKHLTILTLVITVTLFPYFAISGSLSAEDLVVLIPYRGSNNDSTMGTTSKQIAGMTAAVTYAIKKFNTQSTFVDKATKAAMYANTLFVVDKYRKSRNSAKKTERQITDDRGYTSYNSIGEFNQRDWDEQREHAASELRNLQSSLIDQAFDNYIDGVYKKLQEGVKRNESKGYKFDPKTNLFTLPGGESVPAKDLPIPKKFKALLLSPKELETLGLSPKELKKFKEQQKKNDQEAKRQAKATINSIIKSAKRKASRIAAKKSQI